MEAAFSIYPSRRELGIALAAALRNAAAGAIAERGRFLLALSGGSALDLLVDGLRLSSGLSVLDPPDWHVFWADERCVPDEDPENNAAAACAAWLDRSGIPAANLHRVDTALSPELAAAAYEAELLQFAGDPPRLDWILLGMGTDGHVASLFPGYPALEEKVKQVAAVNHSPKPPPVRVSMTFSVLNAAREIAVAAVGGGKAGVVRQVRNPVSGQGILPVQRLQPASGGIRWFLDSAAAGEAGSPLKNKGGNP